MKGGDISNKVPPVLMFIFEGLVGKSTNPTKEAAFCKTHQWKRAVRCWELNPCVVGHLWMLHRTDWAVDVVTFKGEGFANALEDRLSDLPIREVRYATPQLLARHLSPNVTAVYDAEQKRRFAYGVRGVWVEDPENFTIY